MGDVHAQLSADVPMDASVISIWLPSAARSPMIRRSNAQRTPLQRAAGIRIHFFEEVHRVETPYLADQWRRSADTIGRA
jgi:hypothetical protein